MQKMQSRAAQIAVLAALVTFAASAAPSVAASGASGTLRLGGTATGDISKTAGDRDTITIDLTAGSSLAVRWNPGFVADFAFKNPSNDPVELGLDGATGGSVGAWTVPTTGTYTFSIASADGSQGYYALSAIASWPKAIVLSGTGDTTFDIAMPANSVIKGKVQTLPGAAAPTIQSFTAPDATNLLVNPVGGSGATVKLPTIRCTSAGTYRLSAGAGQGTRQFEAKLARKAPKLPKVKLLLENGLDAVSFDNDGVSMYFAQKCASCHDWARAYAGVRAFAGSSLARMRTGNMPKGGPRADAATLGLLTAWIKTGYGK